MKPFNILVETVTLKPGEGSGHVDLDVSKLAHKGETLVVEHISTSSEMPTGQKPDPVIVILNHAGSAVVQHYLVTHFQLVYAGMDIHKSSTAIRMHLPPDLILRVAFLRDKTSDEARCFFGISGYVTKE